MKMSAPRSAFQVRAVLGVWCLVIAGCASPPSIKRSSPVARADGTLVPAAPVPRRGGGYYLDDGPGDNPPPDLDLLPDAVPRVEKYASGANKPYNVFGVDYVPDLSGAPYKQRGVGSWYGRKFHGQRTSSGEIYDMYAMTAAHPTLPIPCYALVTNLQNGRSIIVRVNDRGPFLHNRVMDLSYAAALKIGYLSSGSGMIEVEMLRPADIAAGRIPVTSNALLVAAASLNRKDEKASSVAAPPASAVASGPSLPPAPQPVVASSVPIALPPAPEVVGIAASTSSIQTASSPPSIDPDLPADLIPSPDRQPAAKLPETETRAGFYLQLGAFRVRTGADSFAAHLSRSIDPALASRVQVSEANGLYRVRVGPYAQRLEADSAAANLRAAIAQPVLVMPDAGAR